MVSQNTIIVVAGNKLRLDVEITGEPAPTCVWSKGDQVWTQQFIHFLLQLNLTGGNHVKHVHGT